METTLLVQLSREQLDDLIYSSVQRALSSSASQSSPNDDSDTLLETWEAAQLVKYKESSIYGLVKRKKIPFIKMEGKLLFSKKKLLEWVAKGNHPANSPNVRS